MSYLSRDCIGRIFRSPITFCGALLPLASLAATAFALSRQAPNSLADYVSAICTQRFQSASRVEASYLAENISAMRKMMFDMGIRPSGDVDSDFVAMMAPHHQGAIEMAQAELRYGRNDKLRRLSQEIIVTQQQEIVAMRLALGQPLLPPAPAPDQVPPAEQSRSDSSRLAP
jgi:Domain of unknown function (DUF305)